ncbi:MAG TPA: hypothetical protein VGN69_05010 [Solirubrobacteraceae bacterium]|jgi:hypothetical protein|nr:hypothetical protein [Solirubrobacteraceae bacterium]
MAQTANTRTGPSTGTARRKTAATKRSTTAKKAAATRARNQAATQRRRQAATRKAALTRAENAKTPIDRAAEYAERAVLIPVGVALEARDVVVGTVNDVVSTYSTRTKAETQLKRFERRGTRARNELEREVRKTRTRVERQLRQRRRRVERTLTRLDRRSSSVTKNVSAQVEQVSAQAQNVVQSGLTAGTTVAARVQERVLSV